MSAAYDEAVARVVAAVKAEQRERIVTRAAEELGISRREADRVARMMGR